MSLKSRGQRAETALRAILNERGYIAIRSAASKSLDIVCVCPDGDCVAFEVKSSGSSPRLDLRRHNVEQWEELKNIEQRGVAVHYAVLWRNSMHNVKGQEHWEVFRPKNGPIFRQGEGIALFDFLYVRLPPIYPLLSPTEKLSDGFEAMNSTTGDYRQGDAGSD